MTSKDLLRVSLMAMSLGITSAAMVGCEEDEGPMERAGDKIDETAQDVEDLLDGE